jgi:hypothetical protein
LGSEEEELQGGKVRFAADIVGGIEEESEEELEEELEEKLEEEDGDDDELRGALLLLNAIPM